MQERRFSNRELCALIVPLLFEQFLNLLVGMVDMVMIAGAGEAAMRSTIWPFRCLAPSEEVVP